ncbi:MAG: TlpA disulfide reductase family protein [Nitrospira sp.]|nr:TlpA disulfide reductase family protein [Nitrospira sp.]
MTIATSLLWMSIGLLAASPAMTALGAQAEPAPSVRTQASERHAVRVGDEAPNFRLRDLDGNLTSLSQFRGKVVLLNFWATWCGPCRVEMPAMEQLYRTYSRREFQILAVSTDPQGAAVTRPFQQKTGLSFPILHDTEMQIGLTYGARSLPMTFMVDRQGVVRQKIFGARDWDSPEARELVQLLMKL